MDVIFLLAAAVMLIGFLLLLRVEELPLRTMSGIQAPTGRRGGLGSERARRRRGPQSGSRRSCCSGGLCYW